jgi:hypothetical protein
MAVLAERDAAAAEFAFAVEQATKAIVERDDPALLRTYTNLLNGWARYLEAQDIYFAARIEEVHLRLVSR